MCGGVRRSRRDAPDALRTARADQLYSRRCGAKGRGRSWSSASSREIPRCRYRAELSNRSSVQGLTVARVGLEFNSANAHVVVPEIDELKWPPTGQPVARDAQFQWSRRGPGVHIFRLYAFLGDPRDHLLHYPTYTIVQPDSIATLPLIPDGRYTPSPEAQYAWVVERVAPEASTDDAATESFVEHYFQANWDWGFSPFQFWRGGIETGPKRDGDHCVSEARTTRFGP